MASRRLAPCIAVLCSACFDPFIWDLDTDADIADDLVVALFLATYDDDSVDIRGPHALGSMLPIRLIHRDDDIDLQDWRIQSEDDSTIALQNTTVMDNQIRTELDFLAIGEATVSVLNPGGRVVSDETIEVAAVADLDLFASDDIETRSASPVASDDMLHLATTSELSLAASPLDAEGRPLTGNQGLSVQVVHTELDDLSPIEATVRDDATLQGLDFFDVYVSQVPTNPTTLLLSFGGEEIRQLEVIVHETSELDRVALTENITEDAPEEDGQSIGTVRSEAFVANARVLGVPLRWQDETGADLGIGTYATVESGPPETVTACVPDTDVCSELTLSGQVRFVYDGVASICGCHQGGGSGLGIGLLGLLWTRRRRR